MFLWKILIAISLISWYLPVISFRGNKKYLPYFVVNSLVDPIYIALRYTFNIGMYNYIPIALLCEAMALSLIDAKSRTVSVTALLLITFTIGRDSYLEFIICESVLSLMIYFLLKDVLSEFKSESAFKVFKLLLLTYFLRNGLMFYLYYLNQTVLNNCYTLFLISIIILPILIAYFGPKRKIKISFNKNLNSDKLQNTAEHSDLNIVHFPVPMALRGLTNTELKVLALLAEGFRSSEIAEKLFVVKSTVYFHCQNIREKLNIKSSSQLARFAIENREYLLKSTKTVHFNSMAK